MTKKTYEQPDPKTVTDDAQWILQHLPDEKWQRFFKKKFPDLVAHLAADHSRLPENSSHFSVLVTENEIRRFSKARQSRPGIYAISIAPMKSDAAEAFKKKQEDELSLGFVSLSDLRDSVPKLNEILKKQGYFFQFEGYGIHQGHSYCWIERLDTDYFIPLIGKVPFDISSIL